MGQLDGKVALITGAASGQGAAEARLFHSEGARVILTDVSERGNELANALGGSIFLPLDVASREGWDGAVAHAVATFGRIDVLVNNAGVTGSETVADITREQLQRYLNIHLYGALNGLQAVLPHMPPGGSIINIASVTALRGMPRYAGYGISKWALRGLSRFAARDLVGRGIRVNAILPGAIDTPMIDQPDAQKLLDAVRASIPMKRFGDAGEVARVALFLASDASSYMTGAELVVDGGGNA